ncbi:Thivi_2564 family membrane protein [uncultured Legionella sp.]|uniref:Thivi_2564 family membrane protein n=1 Tax=uncultured Legionella sp. TaxID=210934 RepID=UPI00260A0918|nr:Thivi_2564 family membrane protein [uncultured Legionella sp.]
MLDLNQLVMIFISAFLLWAVNQFIPMAPLINLVFNFLILVVLVIYIMQFLGVVTGVLPSPRLFR